MLYICLNVFLFYSLFIQKFKDEKTITPGTKEEKTEFYKFILLTVILIVWFVMELTMIRFFYKTSMKFVLVLRELNNINVFRARALFGFISALRVISALMYFNFMIFVWMVIIYDG